MTAIQVIPKDKRALSMLKLLADMGIIAFGDEGTAAPSLSKVLASVPQRKKPALEMEEVVSVVKAVRAKHRNGGSRKNRR